MWLVWVGVVGGIVCVCVCIVAIGVKRAASGSATPSLAEYNPLFTDSSSINTPTTYGSSHMFVHTGDPNDRNEQRGGERGERDDENGTFGPTFGSGSGSEPASFTSYTDPLLVRANTLANAEPIPVSPRWLVSPSPNTISARAERRLITPPPLSLPGSSSSSFHRPSPLVEGGEGGGEGRSMSPFQPVERRKKGVSVPVEEVGGSSPQWVTEADVSCSASDAVAYSVHITTTIDER